MRSSGLRTRLRMRLANQRRIVYEKGGMEVPPIPSPVFGRPIRRLFSMFDYLKIVEQKIIEAQERGEFGNLPGHGKPLVLEDDGHIPEELRVAYKILKNADCLPPELQEKKDIRQMEDLLESVPDEKERYKLIKKINFRIMKLNILGKKSPLLEERQIYYGKLIDKSADK
jgi:hypothetical protein